MNVWVWYGVVRAVTKTQAEVMLEAVDTEFMSADD
jgi:hypothetical protein